MSGAQGPAPVPTTREHIEVVRLAQLGKAVLAATGESEPSAAFATVATLLAGGTRQAAAKAAASAPRAPRPASPASPTLRIPSLAEVDASSVASPGSPRPAASASKLSPRDIALARRAGIDPAALAAATGRLFP